MYNVHPELTAAVRKVLLEMIEASQPSQPKDSPVPEVTVEVRPGSGQETPQETTQTAAQSGQNAAETPPESGQNPTETSPNQPENTEPAPVEVFVSDFMSDDKPFQEAVNEAMVQANSASAVLVFPEIDTVLESPIRFVHKELPNIKGFKGAGMGKTILRFNHQQTQDWNPDNNLTDARPTACILVEKYDGFTSRDLTIKYEGEFYRKGQTYFGCVNGLYFDSCSNCHAERVETLGANRAGIMFGSADNKVVNKSVDFYHDRIKFEDLTFLGTGNSAKNCVSHNNRVAGIMVAYQKNFLAEANELSHNGHEADGGTGYGITAMAGSLNVDIVFRNNKTNHNYRKGLDIHDAYSAIIEENDSNGDRFFGIAVENRLYPLNSLVVRRNKITQDPDFRLHLDDDLTDKSKRNLNSDYYRYTGIRVENKQQPYRNWPLTPTAPVVEITDNIIQGIRQDEGFGAHRGIEVRSNEENTGVHIKVDIERNTLQAESLSEVFALFAPKTQGNGLGDLVVRDNSVEAGKILHCPIYLEEGAQKKSVGSIRISDNRFKWDIETAATKCFAAMTRAAKIDFCDNVIDFKGSFSRPVMRISMYDQGSTANFERNTFNSERPSPEFKRSYIGKNANTTAVVQGNVFIQTTSMDI